MTVASDTNKSGPYNGNGVTTAFDYEFLIVDDSHIKVILTSVAGTESVLDKTTDYMVSGVGDTGGGQITTIVAPATGEKLTLLRNVPFVQETDLENQGAYNAEDVEAALDLGVMMDQQLQEQIGRAVKIPVSADPETLNTLIENVIRLSGSADNIDIVADNIDTINDVAPLLPTLTDNLTSIHNFADVYQGPKASDPALRNDGSALEAGDLYFNTTTDLMQVYDGTEWRDTSAMSLNMVPNSFVGNGVLTAFTLTATPAIAANVLVWVGGARQKPLVDYTVSGTTLTLLAAPGNGVEVDTLVVATVSELNIPAIGSVGEQHLTDSLRAQLSPVVTTRAAMAALPTNLIAYRSATLVESGREGLFKWTSSNLSAKVSGDLSQALYVAPSFDTSGASGAWARVYNGPAMATWWGMDTTGITNCGGLISRAFGMSDVKWLHFPAGTYRIDTSPDIRSSSVRITGDGKGLTRLNFSNSNAKFRVQGSITAKPNLSAYMRTERDYASFASAHGLVPNDLFIAFKPAANSYFDANRPGQTRNYTQCESFIVNSVINSTDVKIFGRPSDLFGTSDTSMYLVNSISFSMSDLTIIGGTAAEIVYVLWGRNVEVRNVEIDTKYYTTIEFDRCFGVNVEGVSGANSSTTDGMYGVSFNSCTDFTYDGGSPSAGRHSVSLGQREEVGAGPNRNGRIINTTLRNASHAIGAADMHGCVENIFYDNCVMDGGAILAGKNVSIRNSTIRQIPGDTNGTAVYGSEFLGGAFILENVLFVIHYGNLNNGLIRLSPGNTLKQKCLFMFRNITVVNQLGYDDTDTSARLIYIEARSANMAVNVQVDGITAMVTNLQAILYAFDAELSALNSDFLAVDNPLIKCGGSKYCIYNHADIAAVKTREFATQGVGGGLTLAWPN